MRARPFIDELYRSLFRTVSSELVMLLDRWFSESMNLDGDRRDADIYKIIRNIARFSC